MKTIKKISKTNSWTHYHLDLIPTIRVRFGERKMAGHKIINRSIMFSWLKYEFGWTYKKIIKSDEHYQQ